MSFTQRNVMFGLFFVTAVITLASTHLGTGVGHADVEHGYSIGPYFAVGEGLEPKAQADAYSDMWMQVAQIQNSLPAGETVDDVVIINTSYDPVLHEFVIEFMVTISVNGPPGG